MSEQDAGPGRVLRAQRETLGVSIREVSETLNLSISVIEAIEADDYDHLPGPVFGRGYVRSYARLLELDPQPLMARYPKTEEHVVRIDVSSELPVWEWIRRRPELVLGGAGALLLVLLVALIVWMWPSSEGGPAAALAGPVDDDPRFAPRIPGPYEAASAGTRAAAADPLSLARADDVPNRAVSSPARAPVAIALPMGRAGSGGGRRITDLGDERLVFWFSDDCWVQVRSATGASLYSDLNRAGTELELVGQGPFRILLGYAPGVQLTFNGENVPLGPHSRNNVATLFLGQ